MKSKEWLKDKKRISRRMHARKISDFMDRMSLDDYITLQVQELADILVMERDLSRRKVLRENGLIR